MIFFQIKEQNIWKLLMLANGFGHNFYYTLQRRWRQIPPQVKKQIPLKRRIVLVNYHFALVYIKCVRALFKLGRNK